MGKLGTVVLALAIIAASNLEAESKRPVSVRDCVTLKRLAQDDPFRPGIVLNPTGSDYIYLVGTPNLDTNQTDVDLYVADLAPGPHSRPRKLLTEPGLSSVRWDRDGRHVVVLLRGDRFSTIERIDTRTGQREVLAGGKDIAEFSMDSSLKTIVFATEEPNSDTDALHHSKTERDYGYRVVPTEGVSPAPRRKLWIVRRINHLWQRPHVLRLHLPFEGQDLSSFPYLLGLRLSVSPSGRYTTMTYAGVPKQWLQNETIEARLKGFPYLLLTVVCDLKSGRCFMPLDSPWEDSEPVWSPDGHSFVVNAEAPVNSSWMKEDKDKGLFFSQATHLFQVNILTGKIDKITDALPNLFEAPLAWSSVNTLLVHTTPDTVATFSRGKDRWQLVSSQRIPVEGLFASHSIASDGRYVAGEAETSTRAPYIFLYRLGDKMAFDVADLNPQLASTAFATVHHIRWKTSTGVAIEGTLLLPPDYVEGQRYPLVIQTKVDWGQFACGAVDNDPSYAPQPLATSGIAYLMRNWPAGRKTSDDRAGYPQGYPGQIGEAAFQKDIWESAIRMLVARGIVDEAKVGIVGFSRPGWYAEYLLTQSSIRFRAATIADNVDYTFTSYSLYLNDRFRTSDDAMYGGPPVGSTLESWLKYSPSFNISAIHTPLLMEEMGYGEEYDNRRKPPIDLARRFELLNILDHLGRPAELYYYPDEGHQPTHPRARLASLQRNVAWFRFWLQDAAPTDMQSADTYRRWKELEELQEAAGSCPKLASTIPSCM